jgi:Na+/H+ antiporter NhaA
LIIAGLLRIRNKAPESLIFFILGLGLGYIFDEFDLLLSIGNRYTMQLYDAPLNLAMDVILVLVLLRLSENRTYVHGLLRDAETVL